MAAPTSYRPLQPMRDLSNTRTVGGPQKRARSFIAPPPPPPVPRGFTMLNKVSTEIWSEDALKEADVLDAEADKRNPDLHDVLVYNDFYSYALYDLLEDKFREFHQLLKKDATGMRTWHTLEALTFFIATLDEGEIDSIDDCDRYCAFVRVFAAAWHTVLRCRQNARPRSLLRPVDIPNAENVVMTAAKILQRACDVADLDELRSLREVPTLLAAMLRQDGWAATPKSTCILGEYGETPDDGQGDERPRKRMRSNSTRTDRLADTAFPKALVKGLDAHDKTLNFDNLWTKYEKDIAGSGVPLFEIGNEWASGFDITKWPAQVRAKHSLARQLDDSDDELPDSIQRNVRQFEWVR